jgi:acetyl esterase/lipase
MKKKKAARRTIVATALMAAVPIAAQQPARSAPPGSLLAPAAPLSEPGALPLPAVTGASAATEVWNSLGPGNPVVRNVTRPTLTPFLPDPARATGAAVVIAPGGGFLMLSMETEGFAVARQFAARGVAAFVLKYRLEPTPVDAAAAGRAVMSRLVQALHSDPAATAPRAMADADAIAALRLIRGRAAEWRIDPAMVGMIGYSAGAITALSVATTADSADRPAFVGYVYGPQTIATAPVKAPPLFDALAIDDPAFGTANFPIVAAWREQRRPVELHVYGAGGHGFGAGRHNQTNSLLSAEFVAWLAMQGFGKGPIQKGP